MVRSKLIPILCVALFMTAFSAGARAVTSAHKTMYLTFSQPVQLPGVSLGTGTYIFEIANPNTSGDVVRVLSRDRSTSYFMGFTRARPAPSPAFLFFGWFIFVKIPKMQLD